MMQLFRVAGVALVAIIVAVATQQQDDDDVPQSKTGCLCVSYTMCNLTTLEIVDDGSTLLGPRVNVFQECTCPGAELPFGGECSDKDYMCCHLPGHSTEEEPEEELSWDDCGIKGFDLGVLLTGTRVIAGPDKGVTFPSEFPWMALILNKSANSMVCGGSVLHHHVVMTAAHCVDRFQASELQVRAGVWNKDDLTGTQSSSVSTIIKHEQFGPTNYRNDLALLVLKKALVVNNNVAPICRPAAGSSYDNMVCVATGWGTSEFGTRNYSSLLKKVNLKIVPRAECQRQLRKTRLGPWFKLHESFVCAKGEAGTDTCTGDGGGPLMCLPNGSDKYIQVGITAAGLECGNDIPALYTNIPLLEPWIQEKFTAGNLKDLK